MSSDESQRFDLVPTRLAIAAMRDNGYKNTAYAVAELIDNSIQADARHVELLAGEYTEVIRDRRSSRIHELAILDDGSGMSADTLRSALQFGNGTRLNDRSGIGRFGMGLPSASISQARRVDVWSWTADPTRASYTYIDLDEIEKGTLDLVPEPTETSVPDKWRSVASSLSSSGTLVVWTKLDRMMWRKASTIIDRSEYIIGRMYRRFLSDGEATIRFVEFESQNASNIRSDRFAVANDPLYLLTPTNTPSPYDAQPMFERDGQGDNWVIKHLVEGADGESHPVHLRFSVAKSDVRKQPNAGSTPYGKHAKDNIGVSLMRAGRELDLDQSLVNGYDPRERWWGVEVDFPPALDEVFGVTNNKQSARHFSDVTASIESWLNDDARSTAEIIDEMEENEDPMAPLVDIVSDVYRRLRAIRKVLEIQTRGQRSSGRRHDDSAEAQATAVTNKLKEEGNVGQSDAEEQALSDEERIDKLQEAFEEDGLTPEQARDKSEELIKHDIKYTFAQGPLDGRAFFNVRQVAGEIVIKINTEHAAYSNLVEVLESEVSDSDDKEELASRLGRANKGLKLLLMAWARFEDLEQNPERREDLQDIRTDWGRVAARFLRGS